MAKCKHGLPSEHCAICRGTALPRTRGARATGSGNRTRASRPSSLAWRFVKSDALLTLDLIADLEAGWRECKLGRAFSDQVWLELFGGQRVRVRVSVFPRPRHATPSRPFFVKSIAARDGGFTVLAVGHLLLLSTPLVDGDRLNSALPWRVATNGKPFLRVSLQDFRFSAVSDESLPIVDASGQTWSFQVEALLVVQAPPVRPAPVYRDWFRRFLPGGLPELGRR